MLIWNFYSNVPRELGRFLGDVSGMAEYVTSRESVLFCRHSSCWMLRMGPNKWKRVRHPSTTFRLHHRARLGSIEIQSRSSLDRSHFLARYRSRRAIFYVSCVLKILFPYTRDTLNVSDEPRYCIGVGVADTYFLYRDQPCHRGFHVVMDYILCCGIVSPPIICENSQFYVIKW